jgi:hypothetical protein
MIEGLCYLLLRPESFNLAVIGKTTIMLMIWMSGKKQYVSHQTSLRRSR